MNDDSIMTFETILENKNIDIHDKSIDYAREWRACIRWNMRLVRVSWGVVVAPRVDSIVMETDDDEKMITKEFYGEREIIYEFMPFEAYDRYEPWSTLELEPLELEIEEKIITMKWRR